jgi:hypothetical protein
MLCRLRCQSKQRMLRSIRLLLTIPEKDIPPWAQEMITGFNDWKAKLEELIKKIDKLTSELEAK